MHSASTSGTTAVQATLDALAHLGRVFTHFAHARPWPGHVLGLTETEHEAFDRVICTAQHRNGWFTEENVRYALGRWAEVLTEEGLKAWVANYPDLARSRRKRTVGIIMAGNIPFVGLHDLLCVLISGHGACVKCASEDAGLTPAVLQVLGHIAPEQAGRIEVVTGKLGEVDALIATGSDNTARYFEHYFGHLPRIVRRNRTSVAVLDGSETEAELALFGEDIFRYYGLGCRNVGKVFAPRGFDLDRLFAALYPWKEVVDHGKYGNNYDYHKALWLLDRVPLIENGFLLVKEDTALHSPVGSLFIERYDDRSLVEERLKKEEARIQCIIGHGHLAFGSSQAPALHDYADSIDTVVFLTGLAHSGISYQPSSGTLRITPSRSKKASGSSGVGMPRPSTNESPFRWRSPSPGFTNPGFWFLKMVVWSGKIWVSFVGWSVRNSQWWKVSSVAPVASNSVLNSLVLFP
jgi:hypothetical protein